MCCKSITGLRHEADLWLCGLRRSKDLYLSAGVSASF